MLSILVMLLIGTAPALVDIPVVTAEPDQNLPEEDLEYIGNMCSLACAVWWTVEASSELPPQSGNTYDAGMLNDGDISTAWVEGEDGSGEGTEILFIIDDYMIGEEDYEPGDYPLWGITILNGYRKSPDVWQANGRVRSALLSLNSEPVCIIELLDIMEAQFVSVPATRVGHSDTLSITIIDAYQGSTWHDTDITAMTLMGAH